MLRRRNPSRFIRRPSAPTVLRLPFQQRPRAEKAYAAR